MAEPGGRSKQTMVFMVPSDEHDFGARLVERLGRQAIWTAEPRYRQPASYHPQLLAALDVAYGRSQADLRLTDQARLLGDRGARWFVFGLRPGR
jgi:hypothetical protein